MDYQQLEREILLGDADEGDISHQLARTMLSIVLGEFEHQFSLICGYFDITQLEAIQVLTLANRDQVLATKIIDRVADAMNVQFQELSDEQFSEFQKRQLSNITEVKQYVDFK